MARPRSEGLQYFPLDCTLDEKVKIVESSHGNDGFAWVIKTWQKCYLSSSGEIDLNGARGVFHAENCRITHGKQVEIISTCKEIGLFDEIRDNIFTSNGIQKRIEEVNKRREIWRNNKGNEFSKEKTPRKTTWKTPQKESKEYIYSQDVEKIYAMWPSTDTNNDNRPTGKSSKCKKRIQTILESQEKYPLEKAITLYLNDCSKRKGFIKNFQTFLNQLPDFDSLTTMNKPAKREMDYPVPL